MGLRTERSVMVSSAAVLGTRMRSIRSTACTEIALAASALMASVLAISLGACRFDPAYRDVLAVSGPACTAGAMECRSNQRAQCQGDGSDAHWVVTDDCNGRGLT